MDAPPATWTALCALAFVLGMRHGFDADHLATIDGLTRANARRNPRLARLAGALFSLGHGAVVATVALAVGTLASGWQAPQWLEAFGLFSSAAVLFALAFVNLRNVWVSDPGTPVSPVGIKARFLVRLPDIEKPWAVAAVGALFALSFDTISQATLFALAAGRFGGPASALFVAGLFVAGMLMVDGVNGLWISRLLRRADATAASASRIMALTIAGLGLAIGLMALGKLFFPAVDAWTGERDLMLGGAVVVAVLASFVVAMASARRRGKPAVASVSGALPPGRSRAGD
jgi:high-affinity nickel-transport protein